MEISAVYEDENILAIDKPAGVVVFSEKNIGEPTVADYLLEQFSWFKDSGTLPRYGIAHRLDKDTSGILLVAKNEATLRFLQRQFKERNIDKRYIALVSGAMKENAGTIKTFIGRSLKNRKKQKAYLLNEPDSKRHGLRLAETRYKVVKRFGNFSLLEVTPKTGRKHQIRCHLAFNGLPLAGDKIYGFKGQAIPEGLKRHFLHASFIEVCLRNGKKKKIFAALPQELEKVLIKLK